MRNLKRPAACPGPGTVEFDLPFLQAPEASALLELVEQLHSILYRVYGSVIDDERRARGREQARIADLAANDSDLPF
jgi:hypothetical protein